MDNSYSFLNYVEGLVVRFTNPGAGEQPPMSSHNHTPNCASMESQHQGVRLPDSIQTTSSLIQPTPQPIPHALGSTQEQDEKEDSDLETDETLEMYCSTASQLLKLWGPNVGKILRYSKNKRDKLKRCKATNKVLVDQLKELKDEIVGLNDKNERVEKKAEEDVRNAKSDLYIYMNNYMELNNKLKTSKLELSGKDESIKLLKKTVEESEVDKTNLEKTNKQLQDYRKEDEIAFKSLEAERDTLKLSGEKMQTTISQQSRKLSNISSELEKERNDKKMKMVELKKKAGEIRNLRRKVKVLENDKAKMLTFEQVMNNSPNQLMEIIAARKRKHSEHSLSSSFKSSRQPLSNVVEENDDNESGNNGGGGGPNGSAEQEIQEGEGTKTTTTPAKRKCAGGKPVDLEQFHELYNERINATSEVSSSSGVPPLRQNILTGRILPYRKNTGRHHL